MTIDIAVTTSSFSAGWVVLGILAIGFYTLLGWAMSGIISAVRAVLRWRAARAR